jgi:photosystem II stability/assembly factor-like uncharacterized protein
MTTLKFTNNATTTTTARLSDTDTTVVVAAGTGALFPTLGAGEYFKATLQDTNNNFEIVRVTARADDTMTVARGQDGTLAIPFPANSRFELRVLAGSVQEYLDSIDFLLL